MHPQGRDDRTGGNGTMATTQERKDGEKVLVDELARSISAAIPTLDATEQQIAIATYRLLAAGKAVAAAALARAGGGPTAGVGTALEAWPGRYRDERGLVFRLRGNRIP